MTGDFVIVATTVRDDQIFSLEVRDVHEEEDCEDEPEPTQETTPEQCYRTPTEFFLMDVDLARLVREVFSGR